MNDANRFDQFFAQHALQEICGGTRFEGTDGLSIAEGKVRIVAIGADVRAAFPATGAGFKVIAPVNNLHCHGGAFGGFFGERVVARADHRLQVIELTTGQVRCQFRRPDRGETCLAISLDGRLLATAGLDRTVWLWDLTGGLAGQKSPPAGPPGAGLSRPRLMPGQRPARP